MLQQLLLRPSQCFASRSGQLPCNEDTLGCCFWCCWCWLTIDTYNSLLEGRQIPEIDIKVDSTAITAQTKKLKAKWTPELGQDLNAYHNIDAEVELTSILSEQIALEIDREILADLVNGATAATYYWSRSPGLFVNRTTGAEIGASSAAPDFTGTVSEWYETLIETINDVSAQIHRKTFVVELTHVVCGPEVANILNSLLDSVLT